MHAIEGLGAKRVEVILSQNEHCQNNSKIRVRVC